MVRDPKSLSSFIFLVAWMSLCSCERCEIGSPDSRETAKFPTEKIIDTTFISAFVKDSIKIDISLPKGYNEEEKSYPVIYMTDGYWRRADHDTIHLMSDRHEIPDVIVVGVGYPDDYNFDSTRVRDLIKNSGSLFECIKSEVLPYVEGKFRADTANRTLWGASYGGYFLVYAFTEHVRQGRLFKNYIGASAALVPPYQHVDLLENERALWESTKSLPVNLYLTVGGNETTFFRDSYTALVNAIESHHYSGLRFEHEIIPGTDHYTVWRPTLLKGLRTFLN